MKFPELLIKTAPSANSISGLYFPPMPPLPEEFRVLHALLDDYLKWTDMGDREIAAQVLTRISERANQYANELKNK